MIKPLSILVVILLSGILSHAQKIYSLSDCYRLTLQNNLTIQKAQNKANEKMLDRQTLQFSRLPSLSFNIEHYFSLGKNIDPVTNNFVNESFTGGFLNADLQLNLFSGFNTLYSIQQSRYLVDASEYARKRIELEVLSAVSILYARLLFNREQSQIYRNNVAITTRELEVLNEKIIVGRAGKPEYYIINARLNSERAQLITSQNDSLTAMQELKQLMNISHEEKVQVASIDSTMLSEMLLTDISPDELIEMILQKHPAILEARSNEQAAQLAKKMAKSSLYPTLSIGGGILSNYNNNQLMPDGKRIGVGRQVNNNFGQDISINLHVPIFSKFEFTNRIKKEKLNIINRQYELKEAENTIVTNCIRLVGEINSAKQKYIAFQTSLEQYKMSYAVYQEKFNVGQASALELINAKELLSIANSTFLQGRFELFLRYQLLELLRNQDYMME